MRINELKLRNFRNHSDRTLTFAPKLNLITGPNGSGKTNLIDAVHYLCMTRSFNSSSDRYVVTEGESWFKVQGAFEGEIRSSFEVSCMYSKGDGKQIFVNDSPLERLSDMIGRVPVVVLSPEDRKLTDEGPSERRSFLNSFISQLSTAYLKELIRYNRIRKQRNRLLQEYRGTLQALRPLIEPWDVQLVESGSRIVYNRALVLNRLRGYLEDQFQSLAGMGLKPGFVYRTFCESMESVEEIEEIYSERLHLQLERDLEREQTLTGPHRDEVVFFLGDMELRNYGSQGQHRLFSIALKLAQLFYYSDELDDFPIMLLDDVFGNLDSGKTELILNTLEKHPGQIFVTSASEMPFEGVIKSRQKSNAWFELTADSFKQHF